MTVPAIDDCNICLCQECPIEGSREQTPTKTLCGHIFHRACLGEWLKTRQTCPVCRQNPDISPKINALAQAIIHADQAKTATLIQDREVVRYINEKTIDGRTLLQVALDRGQKEVAIQLIEHGAHVDASNLICAVNSQNSAFIVQMLEKFNLSNVEKQLTIEELKKLKGFDLFITPEGLDRSLTIDQSLINIISSRNYRDLEAALKLIKRLGVSLDTLRAPLPQMAVRNEDIYSLYVLIKEGFDANFIDAQGSTAIYDLVSMPHTDELEEMLVALLSGGVNINMLVDAEGGFTPLQKATIVGDINWVEVLLDQGASLSVHSSEGKPAILYAMEGEYVNTSRLNLVGKVYNYFYPGVYTQIRQLLTVD